jgi:hypothetical protein
MLIAIGLNHSLHCSLLLFCSPKIKVTKQKGGTKANRKIDFSHKSTLPCPSILQFQPSAHARSKNYRFLPCARPRTIEYWFKPKNSKLFTVY